MATTNKMKIAVFVGEFPGLTETFILNQITGLLDWGHRIEIFANKPSHTAQKHEIVDRYDLVRKTYYRSVEVPQGKGACRLKTLLVLFRGLSCRPLATWRFFSRLLHRKEGFSYPLFFLGLRLLCGQYDLVHCHFGPNAFPLVELKQMGLSLRLLTSFHGYDANSYVLRNGAYVYNTLFQTGDFFTANTCFTQQKILHWGCPADRIAVLPASLICSRFISPKETRAVSAKFRVLTVGRLVEKKGYEYSLRAIARVVQKYRNIEYWIVGDGPLKSSLNDLAAQLQLQGIVSFLGPKVQEQIIPLYHQADLFMLPSVTAADGDMEGQALVLQEAQTAGLPVISTRHNGIPDGVLDGQSGFLVPERDAEALAEKILYFIEHPEQRQAMGRRGQEFVTRKYDSRIVNQQLVEIYRNLIAKAGN